MFGWLLGFAVGFVSWFVMFMLDCVLLVVYFLFVIYWFLT